MNYKLLLNTVNHLKPTQVVFQMINRIHKARYVQMSAPAHKILEMTAEPIPRYESLNGDEFTFLNLTHKFSDWNFVGYGTLFTYNQNYFDFINDGKVNEQESCQWIDKFITEIPTITWGMDPYPIALRSINWIKFFCKHPKCATKVRENSLWSQLCLLDKRLEYHLLGNHLLEDAYALYIGGCYFNDKKLKDKAYRLLIRQLDEQTLEDGAHYEQSPMYHCILLDRLLDCINFGETEELKGFAERQLGWLDEICFRDGTWPMFNDSAIGIAPTAEMIFDYAKRLGLSWNATKLNDSGYRKLTDGKIEVIVDSGNITAKYQPGHTHADTTNYELRIGGEPIVVDTGISTYDKTPRRQYERSSIAHNMVVREGATCDSSFSCYEVWGGFRVGKRCDTSILIDKDKELEAVHNGYGKQCKRNWKIEDNRLVIEDSFGGKAISYIHLAAGVDIERVRIEGADKVEILDTKYSVAYNQFIDNTTIAIHFNNKVKYSIS